MGRFVRNQFGQEVYVPSVEERGGPASPIPWAPIRPTGLSDLASPISGMGVVPDIEVEQPVIYDRENLQFENLMLTKEENEWMRQMERERREREQRGEPVDDRPYMQVRPRRFGDTAVGSIVERNRAAQQDADRQQIAQETDSRRRKELEKHKQRRSRQDAMLNSPEAREMARKVQQGTVSEEDFKTWWVSQQDATNAHAWDVSIEGDAYQELWAQLNQEGVTSRMAGDLSGKRVERTDAGAAFAKDPTYPAADPEAKAEVLAELEAEHNKKELEKQARLAGRRDYTLEPFEPNSYETFNLLKERMRSIAASEVVRHKEVRPIGTQQIAGGLHGEKPMEITVYSDPET